MNKKAFTLVELLATIIVLGMLSLIVIPSVIQTIDKFRNRAYDNLFDNVESTARLYVSNNRDTIPNINVVDSNIQLELRDLVNSGMLSEPIKDPKTDENISLDTKIFVKVVAKNKFDINFYYNIPDETAPVITLLGEGVITISAGEPYVDAGATAIDDIDGDITDRIVVSSNVNPNVLGVYSVTYDVVDTAGNVAITVTRTVNVVDQTSPVITMLGDDPTTVELGSVYVDAGATATDDVDGDISGDIIITGTVNPNIIDSYTITYTVSDAAGNTTVVMRTVNVVDTTAPIIAMPSGNSTPAKSRTVTVTVDDMGGISTTKYQWTTSASEPSEASFTTTFASGANLSTPAGVTGNYYLWILAKDNSDNTVIAGTDLFSLDNTSPILAFGTNGNATYAKTRSTTVTASDGEVSIDASSLKYLWNTSTSTPSEGSFSTSFTNGQTISSPGGVSGGYYLWILAKDSLGNTKIARTSVFNLDNTNPVCSTSGSSSSWYRTNRTIGISCSDSHSGTSTCNGASSSSSSVTYSSNTNNTYSYTVVDNVGNSSTCSATVKIDKTPPSAPSIARSPGSWTTGNVTLTPSCSDSGGSGIASCSPTISSKTTGTYTFTARDNAGNTATSTASISSRTEYRYMDKYMDFNGSSSYLKSAVAGIYGLYVHGGDSPFIFQAGFRLDSKSSNFYFFDTGQSDGDPRFALWYRASDSTVRVYAKNSGSVYINSGHYYNFNVGQYYTIRLEGGSDGSRGYSVQINGSTIGTFGSAYRFANSSQYTHIGRRYTSSDYMNGKIYYFIFQGRKADTADVYYTYRTYNLSGTLSYINAYENSSSSYRFNAYNVPIGGSWSSWSTTNPSNAYYRYEETRKTYY